MSDPIVIEITPSKVTFRASEGEPVSLAPLVYVSPDSRRNRVIAVGTAPRDGMPALPVAVFGSASPPSGVSKFDCLAALFTEGLKAIVNRSAVRLRPDVLVRGAETLSAGLGGYERDLLARALEQAGARRVRWPEDYVSG